MATKATMVYLQVLRATGSKKWARKAVKRYLRQAA